MRFRHHGLLAVMILVAAWPLAVRADFASDHPEWFGLTAAPEGAVQLAPRFVAADAFLVRPSAGMTYSALLSALADEGLLVIPYAGEEEKTADEAFLAELGLPAESVQLVDFQLLDTALVGDYGPLVVTGEAGALVVDGKYYPNRPHDDSVPSRLAAGAGTCAYRPPLFMANGHVETDGQGLCVVSSKVYGASPGLTDAQAGHLLRHFLGCGTVVVVQSLQGDAEGRLDTFFRFASPGEALLGEYTVEQDSANKLILSKTKEKLEAELPAGTKVTLVPMPAPKGSGELTQRPSWLPFVVAQGKVLVPSYPDGGADEEAVHALLGQLFAPRAVVAVDSTQLVAAGTRLTGVVGGWRAGGWDTGCTPPALLCASNDVAECGVCFDECEGGEKGCQSELERWKCISGEGGCTVRKVAPCTGGDRCEDALCQPPPSECDTMPEGGVCEGDVLRKCVLGQLLVTDCAAQGEFCSFVTDEAGEHAECVPMSPPDMGPDAVEGSEVAEAGAEQVPEAAGEAAGPVEPGKDTGFNAGQGGGGGCGMGRGGGSGAWAVLAAWVLVVLGRRRAVGGAPARPSPGGATFGSEGREPWKTRGGRDGNAE